MKSDFLIAITQLAAERNLPREVVISAIEAALASAYRADSGRAAIPENITVKILPGSGDMKAYYTKTVVAEPEDPNLEISLAEAHGFNNSAELGDSVEVEMGPILPGRIAAQTAKQVVMQRLREAEREMVYAEFSAKEGDILNGVVQRLEPKQLVVDLGRVEAIMLPTEQVPTERYRTGQRLKFYVLGVSRSARGPQILLSRSHKNLLRRLFEVEVPEIYNGTVELKAVSREPGFRSKVAVSARQEGIDAVGSCVGLRGIRIQNIVNELQGEKIDVIQWHKDPIVLIANSLSPSQVLNVEIDTDGEKATVIVPDRQLSLAIGREGQNARLAARLTGWKIDIKSASDAEDEKPEPAAEATTVVGVDTDTQDISAEAEGPATDVVAEDVPEATSEVITASPPTSTPEVDGKQVDTASAEAATPTEPAKQKEKVRVSRKPKPADEKEISKEISIDEAFANFERVAATPTVRFAEDIGGSASQKPPSTRSKKSKARDDDGSNKPKKTKRQPVEIDQGLEDL